MNDHSPSPRLLQQRRVEATGAGDCLVPAAFDDVPRLAEAGRVGRAHLGPLGIPPVELGLDVRPDVDPVDRQVLDLATDLDVGQLNAPHDHPGHVDAPEPHAGQVAGPELRAGQVDPVEARFPHVRLGEVSHGVDGSNRSRPGRLLAPSSPACPFLLDQPRLLVTGTTGNRC